MYKFIYYHDFADRFFLVNTGRQRFTWNHVNCPETVTTCDQYAGDMITALVLGLFDNTHSGVFRAVISLLDCDTVQFCARFLCFI